jgi:hypothetical protein
MAVSLIPANSGAMLDGFFADKHELMNRRD